MHTIAVYFDEPGQLDYPFDERMYYDSYARFTEFCAVRNLKVVIVRGLTYRGNMRFSNGWQFINGELEPINTPIQADLIYVKGLNFVLQTQPNDLVINDPEFDRIARDKWLTYQAFHEFMAPTFQITNENWQSVRDQLTTDQIVLKPVTGSGGKGILILDRATLDYPSLGIDTRYLAQEFVDSSRGIPGLCDGVHDLRVIMFNGVPKLSYLRMPPPGKLLSNISQGASAKVVSIADVPASVLQLAKRVDEFYKNYTPRLYTTDFFMNGDKAYLVETNTRPGFPREDSEGPVFAAEFYQDLVELFAEAIVNHIAKS